MLHMHALRIALGVGFLLLGVVGSLLPVLQGWIFFLLALVMFFPEHPRVEKTLQKYETRLPRLVAFLRRIGIGHEREPEQQPRATKHDV